VTTLPTGVDFDSTGNTEKMPAFASIMTGEDTTWQSHIASTMLKINKNTEKAIFAVPEDAYLYDPMVFSFIQPQTIIATGSPQQDTKLENSTSLNNSKMQYLQFLEGMIDAMGTKGILIANWHDAAIRKIGETHGTETDSTEETNCWFFGYDKEFCHVWAGNIRVFQTQTIFELNYGVERVEITSRLLGKNQLNALLAAATLAVQNGVPLTSIKKAFEKMETVDHRLQLLEGYGGSTLLDDTLGGDLSTWTDALEILNKLPARRRIVVVGEVKGLGEFSEKVHRDLGQMLYREHVDIILSGTGEALHVSDELKKLGFYEGRLEENLSVQAVIARLLKIIGKGDLVLIKGDESNHLEDIVKKIGVKVK
jgi:UDP-N-acetylmuramyl pentapeptide synthase